MLRKIPPVISPELMKVLMEMGHGDIIVFADANFPAASNAKRLIRADGAETLALLEAILPFFPLDNFEPHPVLLMSNRSTEPVPEIWADYCDLLLRLDPDKAFSDFQFKNRLDFYAYAQKAYAIVTTSTTARYANIALRKGVV